MSDYDCPECDGQGTTECCECGQDVDCDHCDGYGYDPAKVDIQAWFRAGLEAAKAKKPPPKIEDFLLPGAEDEAKMKAFRRAADALVSERLVGMASKRVWLVNPQPDGRS